MRTAQIVLLTAPELARHIGIQPVTIARWLNEHPPKIMADAKTRRGSPLFLDSSAELIRRQYQNKKQAT
jgi:hypothetical protein